MFEMQQIINQEKSQKWQEIAKKLIDDGIHESEEVDGMKVIQVSSDAYEKINKDLVICNFFFQDREFCVYLLPAE